MRRPRTIVIVGGGLAAAKAAEAARARGHNGPIVIIGEEQHRPYAAGDVANAWHPHYQRHVRVEHWANALNQGAAAGRNATGMHEAYDRLPYFYSDQYDLGLEYVGLAGDDDQVVLRGDPDRREFLAFYHRRGVVNAALAVNLWDVMDDLKALIHAGVAVDPAVLANPAIPLTSLIPQAAR